MAKILIIEDNPTNMKLTTMLLARVGHQVLQAVDAETGMALAQSDHPELILMDLQLPGMDGLAATKRLKHSASTADIAVVALTALAMKEDQVKAMAAGCDAYIAKPIKYQELYATIDRLLAGKQT
jgi:two-component system cell cycle response regulator DivK